MIRGYVSIKETYDSFYPITFDIRVRVAGLGYRKMQVRRVQVEISFAEPLIPPRVIDRGD